VVGAAVAGLVFRGLAQVSVPATSQSDAAGAEPDGSGGVHLRDAELDAELAAELAEELETAGPATAGPDAAEPNAHAPNAGQMNEARSFFERTGSQ
jgi:aquaporin Z